MFRIHRVPKNTPQKKNEQRADMNTQFICTHTSKHILSLNIETEKDIRSQH